MPKSPKFFTIMMIKIGFFFALGILINSCVVPEDGYFGRKPHVKIQLINNSDVALTFSTFYKSKPSKGFVYKDSVVKLRPGEEYYILFPIGRDYSDDLIAYRNFDSLTIQTQMNDIYSLKCETDSFYVCTKYFPNFSFILNPIETNYTFKANIDGKKVRKLIKYVLTQANLDSLKKEKTKINKLR